MEMPVALELRTTGTAIQAALDAAPRRPPVLYHVAIGYVVRDALIADRGHQPVAPRTSATTSTKRGRAIIGKCCRLSRRCLFPEQVRSPAADARQIDQHDEGQREESERNRRV